MKENNSTLIWLIAAGAALLIWIGVNEYREVKSSVSEFQVKVVDAVDETSLLVQSIRKTINELREKLFALESQYKTLEAKLAESKQPPVEAKPKQKHAPVRTLVMHTIPNCGSCNVWKSQHMQEWQSNGFEVQIVEDLGVLRSYPWFEIYDGDKPKREIEGVLPWKTYREL